MAAPLYRLHCFLRRAQMLLLFLGIAYLMAGSILLLQRSTLRVSQPGLASLPPVLALPAPPTAPRAPGLGIRARSRWAVTQGVSGGGVRTGRHWPASRNLGVQRLHRRWFHGLTPETHEQRAAVHRSGRDKGTYVGCFLHDASERALGGTILYDLRKMTSSLCQDTCSESGYKFAGVEYGAECHCGNRISSLRAPEEDCGVACRGGGGSHCGGVGRLSVYKVEEQPPGHRKLKNVRYSGCFKIPKNTTNAFSVHTLQPNLTSQSCVETCTDKELPLAVMRRPHCFCAWAASLLRLGQQLKAERCAESLSPDHTASSNPSSTSDQDHYQVYQTPVLDSRCRERVFLPQKSGSLVALSSFPGAGNTWVRHLIELVTGYYTGSFYFDGALYNQGFKGEKDYWKSGRSICVKTHESGQREIEMFEAAILLIRNPYRSLVAEFNRKCAGHLGYATDAQWKSTEWPEFVDSYAPWWASHALSWLKFGQRMLVVHYEDLQRALLPQLRLLGSFLNASVTEERLICARSNQDGHFKRTGAQRPSFDPFTPGMRSTIDSYIHTVDQALRDRNLSGLPQEYLPR